MMPGLKDRLADTWFQVRVWFRSEFEAHVDPEAGGGDG
jgi:hypothetical protein